jgi:hypothetical protein
MTSQSHHIILMSDNNDLVSRIAFFSGRLSDHLQQQLVIILPIGSPVRKQ